MDKRFFGIGILLAYFVFGCASGKNAKIETTATGQYSTLGNNVSETTKIEKVEGDVIGRDKIVQDNKGISEEQIKVKLRISHINSQKGWDELKVDVVNVGEKKVVLEKAYLYVNSILRGTDFLKDPIDKDGLNWDYIKLESGEKYDNIINWWRDPKGVEDHIVWDGSDSWKGKTEVKIETTRGNTFNGVIEWQGPASE